MSWRPTALSVAGWLFGIALSVLFVSLWGRAVMIDTDTLGESLSPLAGTALITSYLSEWMAGEMLESGAPPETVEPMVDQVLRSSDMGAALDRLVVEIVAAAANPDPAGSIVPMGPLLAPAIPDVVDGLQLMGAAVSRADVVDLVEDLDPLVIRSPGATPIVGSASPAATHLGTASLLAVLVMALSGWAHVALSPDRVAAVRSLVTRIAVAGLSFGVMLRLGAWVLDPQGGRAPLRASLSAVAGSKWLVPFRVGAVAALAAALIYLAGRLLKRAGVSPWRYAPPILRPGRPRSRSGSH